MTYKVVRRALCGVAFTCDKLAKLDLSSFNTGNVTTMTSMFSECHALKELDIRGFNTCNVTDMSCMFYECNALSSVDVSGFDTHNVTGMTGMFCECRSLYVALGCVLAEYCQGIVSSGDGAWHNAEEYQGAELWNLFCRRDCQSDIGWIHLKAPY